MDFNNFKKELKLEGTCLDRRRKLSDSQIKEIRSKFNNGEYSIYKLSKLYNVGSTTIANYTDPFYKSIHARNERDRYNNRTQEENREIRNKKQESYNKYIQKLYSVISDCKVNN